MSVHERMLATVHACGLQDIIYITHHEYAQYQAPYIAQNIIIIKHVHNIINNNAGHSSCLMSSFLKFSQHNEDTLSVPVLSLLAHMWNTLPVLGLLSLVHMLDTVPVLLPFSLICVVEYCLAHHKKVQSLLDYL